MSRLVNKSPDPKAHVKTLMRIGYTLTSAVADILDNSITAKSKKISIYAPPGLTDPLISILDDGCGMDEDELIENMVIGCKDPALERERGDLGRFGSGMKTASFSQARRLTVISKKKGMSVVAAVWDIDRIEDKNSWELEILDRNEIDAIPGVKITAAVEQGTQIIWEKLTCIDRGSHSLDHDTELASELSKLKSYIALHFHRFMTGKDKRIFLLNNQEIQPIDPFMTNLPGYQEGRTEKLRCKGGYIIIKTHVLPHFNRMDSDKLKALGGAEGVAKNQGLYIYREGRLINAGGWLDVEKNSQLSALARVEIDVPSSLDHEWSTDVKKSSLQLPPRVKRELKKYLSDPVKRSREVHSYRGRVESANTLWKICENENTGVIQYQIDGENELLIALFKRLDGESRSELVSYLAALAKSIPINHIYHKMSDRPNDVKQEEIDIQKFEENISSILSRIV